MADADVATQRGELVIRTLAMPADTNPAGDIFGGWVLSQMDIAGGIKAGQRAGGRVATVHVEQRQGVFVLPLRIEVQYRDGSTEHVELKVSAQDEILEIPLRSAARRVQVSDDLTLAKIDG